MVAACARAGFDAYGLEQSPEACAIADESAPGRVFQGTEEDLIERGELFDLVTLFHALEHMPEPFRYLKQIQKIMRKPGRLIVQVPNTASWQARFFRSRWYGLDCPRHLYNYNTYSLMHILGRAGFRIHRIRYYSPRDNAAAIVSSLLPYLDPMSQRVKLLRRTGRRHSWGLVMKQMAYLPLFVLAQPFAWLEAKMGKGGTITVMATLDEKL